MIVWSSIEAFSEVPLAETSTRARPVRNVPRLNATLVTGQRTLLVSWISVVTSASRPSQSKVALTSYVAVSPRLLTSRRSDAWAAADATSHSKIGSARAAEADRRERIRTGPPSREKNRRHRVDRGLSGSAT